MAFVAGSIIGKIGLDTSGLSGGIGTAVSLCASAGPAIAAPIVAGLHLIEEAGKKAFDYIIDSVKEAGHRFDDMGEAAERAGVSTQFLSTVGLVAKDSGGSIEELGHAMTILARNAADAAEGNEDAIKSFQKIGLSRGDVAGSLDDIQGLFRQVVSGVGELDTSAERTKSVFDLLGRQGTGLLPLINQGNEGIDKMAGLMTRLGANVTAEDAKAGDAFGRLATLIDAAWQGVANTLARPILQYILGHEDEVVKFITDASDLLRDLIPPALSLILAGLVDIIQAAQTTLEIIHNIAAISDALDITKNAAASIDPSLQRTYGLAQRAEGLVINLKTQIDAAATADRVARKIQPEIQRQANIFEQKLGARVANGRAASGLGGRATGGSDFGGDSDFGEGESSSPGADFGGSSDF